MKRGMRILSVILALGLLLMIFVPMNVSSVSADGGILGPVIEGEYRAFVAADTPPGASCSWSLGAKELSGSPTMPTCGKFVATQQWEAVFWVNPAYFHDASQGGDHAAFWVDGPSGSIVGIDYYPAGYSEVELTGKVIGIGVAAGNILRLHFDPAGGTQIVQWGSDPQNMTEYGPAGNVMSDRGGVVWLANEVPPGSDWFSAISNEYRRDHPGETCAESILFKNTGFGVAGNVPMIFCAQWEMQKDNPANNLSGFWSGWVKAGPHYADSLPSLSEPGLVAEKLALWIMGEADVFVKWYEDDAWVEQRFEVRGSSRGMSFVLGDPEVYFEITLTRVGAEALIRWGPNYGPWWAEFGPSGSLQN